MKNIKKYLITVAIVLIGVGVFYNKVYLPKTTYEIVSPTSGELLVEVFGVGDLGAKNIYTITAQTGGKILNIYADEGKWVKKGDLLIAIDPIDMPELLEEAEISVKKASSELIASKKELESLKAQKNLALVTFQRYEKLKKQSFASQSEYDKAKADLDVIYAQMKATKARINSANIEVKRAKKNVEALKVKLSRFKIYAPVDGYVISKDAEVAQSVISAQSILKIVDANTVWVKTYVDEKISGDIRVGQSATITLRSQRDKKYKGIVKRIVAQSDAVTQEKEIDVAFEKLPIPFYINEQAEVLIATKHLSNVVKIPSKFLVSKNGNLGMWVKENSKAHFKKLDITARGENEISASNLSIDDKIIVTSSKKKPLYEGVSIRYYHPNKLTQDLRVVQGVRCE